ncbi:MAG: PEGA domain-containing protein [Myxococcota bacterium]|nr:PEGA domain-containing protein [Myxococcota bacterium]
MKNLIPLLLMGLPATAFAEQRIAVLDIEGSLSLDLKNQLADEARAGALHALPASDYSILTRENMMSILKDMGKDPSCIQGECEIDLGRSIGADYIISGSVVQIEGVYLFSIKLHETQGGSLLAATRVEGEQALSLIRNTAASTEKMLETVLVVSEPISPPSESPITDQLRLIQFNSNPNGAAVLVNGEMICPTTPCTKAVPPGFHTVEYFKTNYRSWKREFQAKNGLEIRAALTPHFSSLDLKANIHGLDVYIDGNHVGTTPLVEYKIEPGPRLLQIEGDCFESYEERFVAREGAKVQKDVQIEKDRSYIKVESVDRVGNAIRGKVFVDGEYMGQTPYYGDVSSCAKRVEVEVSSSSLHGEPYYRKRSFPLSLRKDQTEHVQLQFDVGSKRKKKRFREKKKRFPW